jgi:hypothetical protein
MPRRATLRALGSGRIACVPELDLIGEYAVSPNGHFQLIWRDRHWADGLPVRGRYALIGEGVLLVDAGMERPQHGMVADDGTFILDDCGPSDALSGTFRAFRPDGSLILARAFSANLLNNGLSQDGRLAACQTCNAPGSADSSLLTVFDLAAGSIFAAWVPESGWADGYEFPAGGKRIRMVRRDRPSLDYGLDGTFLDRALWLKDEVARGTLYVIRVGLAEDPEDGGLSLDALRAGLRRALADSDDRFAAQAWRLLGELEEKAGNAAAALAAYDEALRRDPKIGVAKRAAALRKGACA